MSLRDEIRQLLAGYNTPAEIADRIADGLAKVDRCGLAPGLQVGDKAPDFSLTTHQGQEFSLSKNLAEGPVVITFFRGAWCPVCNL